MLYCFVIVGLSLVMASSMHSSLQLKSPEVGVGLPIWRGNRKQPYTQTSHLVLKKVILGGMSPGTQTNKQTTL